MERTITGKVFFNINYYRDFTFFNMFRGKYYRLKQKLWPLFTVLVALVLVILGFVLRNTYILFAAGVVILAGGIFLYLIRKTPLRVLRRNKTLAQTVRSFTLTEKYLAFENETGGILTNEKHNLTEFVRIYETFNAFYFYLDSLRAYIVPKECFLTGTANDTRLLLEENAPKTFIHCQ